MNKCYESNHIRALLAQNSVNLPPDPAGLHSTTSIKSDVDSAGLKVTASLAQFPQSKLSETLP